MLTRDEHEALLSELFSDETTEDRKIEIQLALRNDHINYNDTVTQLTQSNVDLSERNQQLQVANSQLFREARLYVEDVEANPEEEKKEFSETITIEDLIKNN